MKQRFAVLALVVVAVVPSVIAGSLSDDANLSYTFDNSDTNSGSTVDVVGSNDGDLQGGVTTGVGGVVNEGFSFDGSDDRVQSSLKYSSYSGNISFSFWLKDYSASSNTFTDIISNYDGSTGFIVFGKNDDLQIFLNDGSSSIQKSSNIDLTSLSSYTHLTVVVEQGNQVEFYKNGNLDSTVSISSTLDIGSGEPVTFMSRPSNSDLVGGDLDEPAIFNSLLNSSQIDTLYNNGSGFQAPYPTVSNFIVKAENAFDQSTIQNFSADITGQETGTTYDLNTTNGEITTSVLSNSTELWDVNVSSDSYFDEDFANINVSENTSITASLDDNRTRFTQATSRITNETLTDFNITIQARTFQSNNTFASPDRYNATFSKAGWFNKTSEFTATLNNEFTGVYNHEHTVNVSEIRNGLRVQNFTARITGPNNFVDSKTVTDGNATFQVVQGKNYTVSIPDTNEGDTFATRFNNGSLIMQKDITPTTQSDTTSFETFTYNSLDFSVFDINQPGTVLQQPVNISLINGPEGRELTGQNGSLFVDDLLTGDYTARIQSSGFAQNDYFFDVSESSFQRIDAYLDKDTTQVFFTVVDSQRNELQDAVITMNHKVNGSLKTVGQKRTDFSGTASFDLDPSKRYEFNVVKNDFSTFTGSLTPTLTEYTVPLARTGTQRFTSPLQGVDIRTNTTTGNNTFEFDYQVVARDNDLQSTSYEFTYDNKEFSGFEDSQPSGASFTENISLVPTDNQVTVDYNVTRNNNTASFTRTFLLEQTSGQPVNLPVKNAGPVTKGVIAFLVITFGVTAAYALTASVAGASFIAAAMLGFFTWFNFLPTTITVLSIAALVSIVYSRSTARTGA